MAARFTFCVIENLHRRDINGDDRAPIRHQFGGSLGGPIVKNKTFFYTVYDQQDESQALIVRFNTTTLPPDILAQQGRFQTTNDVFTYLVKIDHQLSANHQLFGRYNLSRNDGLNGTNTGFGTGVTTSAIVEQRHRAGSHPYRCHQPQQCLESDNP